MDILTHNKFNSELSLFFLASNKHASRKALPIVSSKVPKNKLVNYFGVKFSSFKFFYKHNEITLQNNLLLIADHTQSPILHDEARLFLDLFLYQPLCNLLLLGIGYSRKLIYRIQRQINEPFFFFVIRHGCSDRNYR